MAHPIARALVPLALFLAAAPAVAIAADPAPGDELEQDPVPWDARAARHLLNRAGFGARPSEIERAVEMGRAACVAELLAGRDPDYAPFYADVRRPSRDAMAEGDRAEMLRDFRASDRLQMAAFGAWWVEQMMVSGHPLRERMTLFWHGYFTSSHRTVKSSAAMIRQNELFRTRGLGNFRELLREVLRDPAMLLYLDGFNNSRAHPNENLARELLELFALGEGHYSETDVREAARALTGWGLKDGRPHVSKRKRDTGEKSVLGVTGNLGADELVDVLLAQEACPRWVARRLLIGFEGVEPSEQRVAEYAAHLVAGDWEIAAFCEQLFGDPHFYSDDVVGQRVASPIDYLVGTVRRLRTSVPPILIGVAAAILGERLFEPPNVQGWPGGMTWITTSTYQQRGNFAGMLLGVVRLEDVLSTADLEAEELGFEDDPAMMGEDGLALEPDSGPDAGSDSGPDAETRRSVRARFGRDLKSLRRLRELGWRPQVNLTDRLSRNEARKDGEILGALFEELLAVEVSPQSRRAVRTFLKEGRTQLDLKNGQLLDGGLEAEMLLRRTAHVILSLPEAQLH